MESTPTGVETLLTSVQGDLMTNVNAALPIAGSVFALIAGIFIAVKIFKRITGARA